MSEVNVPLARPMKSSVPGAPSSLGQPFEHNRLRRRFFSFNDIETQVLMHRARIEAASYTRVVAIARGGLYAAGLLSQITGLPLTVAIFDRGNRTLHSELGSPQIPGDRLLVVDDIAGLGYTLSSTVVHFQALGWRCDTFVLAWDDLSRTVPTYGLRLGDERAVWPWERGVLASTFDAERKSQDRDAWRIAFDLDGVFLADVPDALYIQDLPRALAMRTALPAYTHFPPQWRNDGKSLIISARLQSEQHQTEAWLACHGLTHSGVFLREGLAIRPEEHKARTIAEQGITEFVESDLDQARAIANLVPFCVVWHYDAQAQHLHRCG